MLLKKTTDQLSKRLALINIKKLIGEIQIKMDYTEPSHLGLYSKIIMKQD